MKSKRYWLRGGVIGILLPIIGAAIFSLILVVDSGDSFWQQFGFIFVFMAIPAIYFTAPLGVILGLLYGKVKKQP